MAVNISYRPDKELIEIEFEGEHYLTKEDAMAFFNWNWNEKTQWADSEKPYGHSLCSKLVNWLSLKEKNGYFTHFTSKDVYFYDKSFWKWKRSILEFYVDYSYSCKFDFEPDYLEKGVEEFKSVNT